MSQQQQQQKSAPSLPVRPSPTSSKAPTPQQEQSSSPTPQERSGKKEVVDISSREEFPTLATGVSVKKQKGFKGAVAAASAAKGKGKEVVREEEQSYRKTWFGGAEKDIPAATVTAEIMNNNKQETEEYLSLFSQSPSPLNAPTGVFQSQTTTTLSQRPSSRSSQTDKMNNEEVDRALKNITGNFIESLSTDVMAQMEQQLAKKRGQEEEQWDEHNPKERVFLNEEQNLKLGFAMHKLGHRGITEAIDLARLRVMQNLMGDFYNPDVNAIIERFKFRAREETVTNILMKKIAIFLAHIDRAKTYLAMQQKPDITGALGRLQLDKDEKKDKASTSTPSSRQHVSGFSSGQQQQLQQQQTDGNTDARATKKRMTNIEMDHTIRSFVTIMKLAAMWEQDKYKWYVDCFDETQFTKMMSQRLFALERDWVSDKRPTQLPQNMWSRFFAKRGREQQLRELGIGGRQSGNGPGAYPGRFSDSFF